MSVSYGCWRGRSRRTPGGAHDDGRCRRGGVRRIAARRPCRPPGRPASPSPSGLPPAARWAAPCEPRPRASIRAAAPAGWAGAAARCWMAVRMRLLASRSRRAPGGAMTMAARGARGGRALGRPARTSSCDSAAYRRDVGQRTICSVIIARTNPSAATIGRTRGTAWRATETGTPGTLRRYRTCSRSAHRRNATGRVCRETNCTAGNGHEVPTGPGVRRLGRPCPTQDHLKQSRT